MSIPNESGRLSSADDSPGGVDLDRVWTASPPRSGGGAPGRIERAAARLLRSPGLARALVTTPSLLLPWLISTVVVFGVGALVSLGPGQPLVWLLAPAVAATGVAFAYGPGIDPAWELSSSCALPDRMVLLTRVVAVFAVNAVLGLLASAASGAAAALTFGWLIPMTAVCALALAVAVAARSAIVGAGAGVAAWVITVLVRPDRERPAHRLGHERVRLSSLPRGRGLLRRDRLLRDTPAKGAPVNVDITDAHRSFGKNKAVDGVDLQLGTGVFGLLGPNGAGKTSLLRMLATVLPPSSGEIRLLERDPRGAAARREIRRRLGYLPQNLGYYPSFTVVEFIEYFALLKEMPSAAVPEGGRGGGGAGRPRREGEGQAAHAVRRDAAPRRDRAGDRERPGPAAARRADRRPRPGAAGAVPGPDARRSGTSATVIVSTHLVEDVGAACSEVALMSAGKIVFRGTPDELTARGEGHGVGDAPLERGYSAVLSAARS